MQFDFRASARVRRTLRIKLWSVMFHAQRSDGSPLARAAFLVHEVGHALSLGLPIDNNLEFSIDETLRAGGQRFSDHNEALVLNADVITLRRVGCKITDAMAKEQLESVSWSLFCRVQKTSDPQRLAHRVTRWLTKHGVVVPKLL